MSSIRTFEDAIPAETCAELIRLFDSSGLAKPGCVGYDPDNEIVKSELKRTMDIDAHGLAGELPEWYAPVKVAEECIDKCMLEYASSHVGWWLLRETNQRLGWTGIQIQRYGIGDYFKPHIDCNTIESSARMMAGIIYLNDVEVGGQTTFAAQGVSVEPEAGKLILFPPFWTHPHEGCPPISGPKYVATFFMLYMTPEGQAVAPHTLHQREEAKS